MRTATAGASAEVRLEVRIQLEQSVHAAFDGQAVLVECQALELYRSVLARDPLDARSMAQVAGYGDAFAAYCDARPSP